jgi:hypothetical protein
VTPRNDEEAMPRSEPEWRDYVAQKFRDGDDRMSRMEDDIKSVNSKVDKNTEITQSIKEDTAGLVETWRIGENTGKAARYIGTAAIWIVKAGVAVGVLWMAFKGLVSGKGF